MKLLIGGELVDGDGRAARGRGPRARRGLRLRRAAVRGAGRRGDRRRARGGARPWAATPAGERAELLHEVAARIRAKTDELAETMTREGGKPRIENSDEVGWVDRGVRLLRRDGPQLRGPRDPADRGLAARARGQGADGRRRLHRAVELPAAAARVEARARAGGRQRVRVQAVGADAAVDARAGRLLRAAAARRRQPRARAAATSARASSRTRAWTASRSPARSRPASGSRTPASTASRASTSSSAARTRSSSAPTSRPRSRSPRAAARGRRTSTPARCARRRSASTSTTRSTTTSSSAFVDHARSLRVGDPLADDTDMGPMVSEAPAREGRAPARGGGRRRRRDRVRRRPRRPLDRGWFMAPTVVTGAAAETALLSEETFGPVAPIVPVQLARRGDRARQLDALRARRQRLHARPQDDLPLHARAQGRARCGSTTR